MKASTKTPVLIASGESRRYEYHSHGFVSALAYQRTWTMTFECDVVRDLISGSCGGSSGDPGSGSGVPTGDDMCYYADCPDGFYPDGYDNSYPADSNEGKHTDKFSITETDWHWASGSPPSGNWI